MPRKFDIDSLYICPDVDVFLDTLYNEFAVNDTLCPEKDIKMVL